MRRCICLFFGLMMVIVLSITSASAVEIVTKTRDDGSTYNGWFSDSNPNGFGICTYPEGDMYYGQWVEGKRNGFGAYLFSGGGMAAGFWSDNEL